MLRQSPARALPFGLLSALLCFLATGCGGDAGNRISGKVTFKGQPISTGKIHFIPDASKGNKGATGYADIKNGAYDTGAPGGRGCIGGPILVKIEGFEPLPADKMDKSGEITTRALFPAYQTAVDLPKETTTKDFDVPADAAKGLQGKPGEVIP